MNGKCEHDWLQEIAFSDRERATNNLCAIQEMVGYGDLQDRLNEQLKVHLMGLSDPDMALNYFERFFRVARSPLSLATLFQRDPSALPILLKLFSSSEYLGDLLIKDREAYDGLRMTEGQPVTRELMITEICNELERIQDGHRAAGALVSYKNRETLRIAFGDIVAQQSLKVVTKQISWLADAICEAALRFAKRKASERIGNPRLANGERCRFVILALGKLGGEELNYSSDIDLIMLFEGKGQTDGERSKSNQEYFALVVREFVALLQETTEHGSAYRVDLRLRPEGSRGQAALSVAAANRYYDMHGRTWERQAYVKARPIAGDVELGETFLNELQSWIYRPNLSQEEITSIKSLKRRIEHRAFETGDENLNIKTGFGGIRDIEFTIQFFQLLHGAELPKLRKQNTLRAIDRLQRDGCLSLEERFVLEENYIWLRNVEHRLQVVLNRQTHSLPEKHEEIEKLARRMGFQANAREQFLSKLKDVTFKNRKILDHLLHDAYSGEDRPEDAAVIDLVLHSCPPPETIQQVLSEFNFRDPVSAYQNLADLSSEKNLFLSSRRCRHFLSSIAPRLLEEIRSTPDPDATLVALNRVSDSLGGKAVLWELFHRHENSLKLYVKLCASSPLLTNLLVSNPGMIDDLMDALRMNRLPDRCFLQDRLAELMLNAEDRYPILHSFKSSQLLNIGVRDLMGWDDATETFRALSEVAEVCVEAIAKEEFSELAGKYGHPQLQDSSESVASRSCEFAIVALGKLGGHELNYHSDLDLIFVYEADGKTDTSGRKESTTNQHFFHSLASNITKSVCNVGPFGKLYELDARLRPTGKSGALAVSLEQLGRYFATGQGQVWEQLAVCKSLIIYSTVNREKMFEQLRSSINPPKGPTKIREYAYDMRLRTQDGAAPENIKRGIGGTMDIEFLVQTLQLENLQVFPQLFGLGTLAAIEELKKIKQLSDENARFFDGAYRQLRHLESRLHLSNLRPVHNLESDGSTRLKINYMVGQEKEPVVSAENIAKLREQIRERFFQLMKTDSTSA